MKYLLTIFALLLALPLSPDALAQQCTVETTRIPADIPLPNAEATPSTFQQFSWDSFLGLNAAEVGGPPAATPAQDPMWREWSSVVDMLSCQVSPTPAGCECVDGDCDQSGARFYPASCRGIPGYQDYRVLAQRGKYDDSFLQASVGGVTNHPVVDRFGNFLKYEILVSPVGYATVMDEALWDAEVLDAREDDLNFACGTADYTGGDPAHPDMGDITLKVAWMDVDDEVGDALDLSDYYTEKLLIHTPAYRTQDGVERCELRNMAMVGLHIVHKTLRQPGRIWSTFEHRDLAPNCEDRMPGAGNVETNMSCPDSVDREFNFYGTQCNDDDPTCSSCNISPAHNDPLDVCRNPTTPELEGWCLDQEPAAAGGTSKLCRHVAVEPPIIDNVPAPLPNPLPENYPQAAVWNQACVNELVAGDHGPWSNYMLISGQWLNSELLGPEPEPPATLECINVVDEIFFGIVNAEAIEPKVLTSNKLLKPFLGNITMESYGKSNCIGCHSRGVIDTSNGDNYNLDFSYYPSVNVFLQDGHFMTHMAGEPEIMCEHPDAPGTIRFDLTGGAAGTVTTKQQIELLVGIEFPEEFPDPQVFANDFVDPLLPWTHAGVSTLLLQDASCTSGNCEVDSIFPSEPGRRWYQMQATPNLTIDPDYPEFATRVTLEFGSMRCGDLDDMNLRLWISDTSQLTYANQVDGDFLDRILDLLPGIPPWIDYEAVQVPTLGRSGLAMLVLVLLAFGLWQVRRF